VTVLDEEPALGGSLRWWPEDVVLDGSSRSAADLADALCTEARRLGVDLSAHTSAVGVYDPWEGPEGAGDPPVAAPPTRPSPPLVVASREGTLTRFSARRLVFATGRHEGACALEGEDRPGVVGVRGACILLAHGVLPGERVVLVGRGAALEALGRRLSELGAEVVGPVPDDRARRVTGRPEVSHCELEEDGELRKHACDTVVVAAPTSAVYELAAQAGVATCWGDGGHELRAEAEDGATAAPDVRVVGWAAGVHGLAEALAQAERAGKAAAAELSDEGESP